MPFVPFQAGELPNLVDVAKRTDPDGSIAKIAELLMQTNPILEDFVAIQGNTPTGHRTTIRSDIPDPTFRQLNYGVRDTKSKTIQVDDTIGMLEDYGEVDKDLALLNGNTAEFRLSEDKPHMAGMSNKMAQTLFYGDTSTNPDRFLGIAPRYNSLTLSGKPNAVTPSDHLKNVVDMGGTGANLTSAYFIVSGEDAVHTIYPKGSDGGLSHQDLGEVTLQDNDGGKFQGYRSHYQWKMGLVIRDWRAVARVANIDLNDIDTAAIQSNLYRAMIKAMYAVPAQFRHRGVWYCSTAVTAMLDLAAVEKTNAQLGFANIFGQEILAFRKRPIRECDAILENEAQVT